MFNSMFNVVQHKSYEVDLMFQCGVVFVAFYPFLFLEKNQSRLEAEIWVFDRGIVVII